jgi:hypothetical protein
VFKPVKAAPMERVFVMNDSSDMVKESLADN